MSDLSLGPPPSSNPVRSIVVAAVVLILAAVGFFLWIHQQKAELTVLSSKPYVVRIENKAVKGTMHVIGTPASIENTLYVVLSVRLTNHLREPMFLKDETFTLTSPDQTVASADALQKQELDTVLLNFPNLKLLVVNPLYRDTRIDPGQSAEGSVVISYPTVDADFWNKRLDGQLTFSFFHQPNITVRVPNQ